VTRERPTRPTPKPTTPIRSRRASATKPRGGTSGSVFRGLLRYSRPRSASETLVLCLGMLATASILAGLWGYLTTRNQGALDWGVVLLAVALIVRGRALWERLGWTTSFRDARRTTGVVLIFVVLVIVTADIVGHELGSSSIPLLGPMSAPWLAYPVLTVCLLGGIALLVGQGRVTQVLGVPADIASQARLPKVSRVTRQTEIDRTSGAMTDRSETDVLDLRSTPLLGRGRRDHATSSSKSRVAVGRTGTSQGLPPIELLNASVPTSGAVPIDLDAKARTIEEKLATFGVGARVVDYHRGPTVTLFDVDPDPGVKVKRIVELQNDLALALAAPSVRIQAPVPGRPVVGIEIPNTITSPVTVREILESPSFHVIDSPLRVAVGKAVGGESVSIDLASMPHLLIAGATGSGKSVMLNVLISSLLMENTPEDVRMLMIDPKMVELAIYNGVPHLLSPVVIDRDKVLGVLRWTIREMERRYALFRDTGVRNLARYNQRLAQEGRAKLPFIVLIVDELADLMMVAPDEVEDCICRLAQLARATGIHLVVATQRPSVDVVTGLIKANFPARMAFAMSSQVDSRTILDQVGAEKLLGRGDMLYQSPTAPKPVRVQAALISDGEIEKLVGFWRDVPLHLEQVSTAEFEKYAAEAPEHSDALLESAKQIVKEHRRASVSLLQRKLAIGYQRAARLMDMLEKEGYVRSAEGGRFKALTADGEEDEAGDISLN
jgi:DNA segregation ATPase FtsK/SpoIIIE-like protein